MRLTLLITALILNACTLAPASVPVSNDTAIEQRQMQGESLFSSDAAVLSDEAIERILQFRWQATNNMRIAVLPFGSERWYGWSEELTEAVSRMHHTFNSRLRSAKRVESAAHLPTILTPKDRTVARLREAAARFQADLLLIYRTQCHSFEKYSLLQKNRSRARCTADALLLDTRTGLVPFSIAANEHYDTSKSETDLNFRETVLRAQLEATRAALDNIATQVLVFLEPEHPGSLRR